MATLSDLYLQDVGEDAIYVPEYPISCKELYQDSRFKFNKTQWKNDYPVTSITFEYFAVEGAHQALSVLGSGLRTSLTVKPSSYLEQHWMQMLGECKPIRYADFGEESKHVTSFPMEDLRPDLHAVDPDVHYKVHSKAFIGQIPCPQASILNKLEFPCVLKVCRAGGGKGTFIINNIEDYNKQLSFISTYMPHAETILTIMVQNVEKEYNCGFYVNKSGEMRWLGAALIKNQKGAGTRRIYSLADQSALEHQLKPSLVPVAKSLHKEGYFGIVGCDLLVDRDGNQYVIDINPRLNTCTIIFLLSKRMTQKGYNVGVLHGDSVTIKGNIRDTIEICESAKGGEIFIRSAVEQDHCTKCYITLFGDTEQACDKLLDQVCIPPEDKEVNMNKIS